MPAFFIILFKINLVLVVFAAAYYLVLRKLTFYTVNRAFLIFGILFSSAYPFINLNALSDRYSSVAEIAPQISKSVSAYVEQGNSPGIWQIASIVFWAGTLLMAIRLALQFYSLYRIHQNSEPAISTGKRIRILTDDVGPFSFWQTIYVNPDLHAEQDLHNILEHEMVHVQEWHTLDIILAEASLVFYWFNPGVWLMKRAVRENIEFITDARILGKGIDRKTYQYSLLHAGQLVPAMAIVNNFNLSDLKKRIRMMNSKRSSPLAFSRYFFVLPILLISTLAFTITGRQKTSNIISAQVQKLIVEPGRLSLSKTFPSRKKLAKIVKRPATMLEKDTLKHVILIKAFDADSNLNHEELDLLPEPQPGDRIKMIVVRKAREEGGSFSLPDTSGTNVKNVFIVRREGDTPPPHSILNFEGVKTDQLPSINGNVIAKFFLNGEEITREEFQKMELLGRNGAVEGKKLRIEMRKEE